MLKLLLAGSSVFLLWLTSNLPAFAQTEDPVTQTEEQAETLSEGVSSEELQQLAQALKQLQAIQDETEAEILQAIQDEGLSPQKYQEILQESEAEVTSDLSAEQKQSFERAYEQVSQLQHEAESKMEQAVEAEGLEVERFNQLLAFIEQDPALLQQVQQLLQE